jgi:hypothetical protein
VRRDREKGYWVKRSERFGDGAAARARAGLLRTSPNVQHVTTRVEGGAWVVRYSVAKWYLDECEKAGVRL